MSKRGSNWEPFAHENDALIARPQLFILNIIFLRGTFIVFIFKRDKETEIFVVVIFLVLLMAGILHTRTI